jgi:plastocyanin
MLNRSFEISGLACFLAIAAMITACSKDATPPTATVQTPQAPVDSRPIFHVDPSTAGSVSGTIRFVGKKTAPKPIDMSEDPACVAAHHGKPVDESLLVSSKGTLANAFIYLKSGLDGKRFETPAAPVVIDQSGCWFHPRVLGIQTNQTLSVVNSDPVTHNIHPMAQINREWNHSQGAGDAPLARKFIKPEVMIRVKCNIHSWMRAFIGVVDNPYFAVSKADGTFKIEDLSPGTYTFEIWQENLGTQDVQITIAPHRNAQLNVVFKGQ